MRAARPATSASSAERVGDDPPDLAEVVLVEAAHRAGGRAHPHARGDRRRPLVERNGVPVDRDVHLGEALLGVLARPLRRAQVDLEQVRVGAAGEDVETAGLELRRRARRRSRAPASGTRGTRAWPAIRKQVAFAAITCSIGPPCIPGKTARSSACACSSRQRTKPERGPESVLCVVEETKSQCGTGFGCSPAATSPAKCAMSQRSIGVRPRRRSRGSGRPRPCAGRPSRRRRSAAAGAPSRARAPRRSRRRSSRG